MNSKSNGEEGIIEDEVLDGKAALQIILCASPAVLRLWHENVVREGDGRSSGQLAAGAQRASGVVFE